MEQIKSTVRNLSFFTFKVKTKLYEFSGKQLNIMYKTDINYVQVLKSKHVVNRRALRFENLGAVYIVLIY